MLVRIGNGLLIVMLLVTTGGHWALLQSFAWTTMLADNLHSHSFEEAMSATFDGQHPCKMCCAILAAKKSEKKTELTISAQKIAFPPLAASMVLYAPTAFKLLNPADIFAESAALPPPVPPPRSVPA